PGPAAAPPGPPRGFGPGPVPGMGADGAAAPPPRGDSGLLKAPDPYSSPAPVSWAPFGAYRPDSRLPSPFRRSDRLDAGFGGRFASLSFWIWAVISSSRTGGYVASSETNSGSGMSMSWSYRRKYGRYWLSG